jgi:glutamate-ammonia-ligase adenylyltransferase
MLIRRPQLLEEITRDKSFNQPRSIPDHLARLDSFGADAVNLDPVRAYRQRQTLRIIMRDVLGLAELSTIFAELSDLAEACVVFTNKLLGGENLTLIALGKFGGRDLNYGADLDVIFVGDDSRAAQNLIAATTQPTAEGTIAAMDARLRPDGEKGALVAPLAAYESYYRDRAQLWEIQALSRARPISGPSREIFVNSIQTIWRKAGQQSDLFAKIDNMLDRIHRERSSGLEFLDFKTGTGGMIEAEFLVQALQMRAGVWEPNWEEAVARLIEHNVISKKDGNEIARSYKFLRRVETALRRLENKNISGLPPAPEEQARLSQRLNYKTADVFVMEYQEAREAIHAIYDRHVKSRTD